MNPRHLAALAAAAVAAVIPAATAGSTSAPSAITVTQTSTGTPADCPLPAIPAVSGGETADAFTVTVRLTAPWCNGGTAWAAVYAMPGSGVAWPQRLVESTSFAYNRPGTTVIRFAKACDAPVQFDVMPVRPPAVANSPLDAPVLTPGNPTLSARQWSGKCPTTTTEPSTTTTESTTTTASTTTASTTTVPDETTTTTTTVPTDIGTPLNITREAAPLRFNG